jgi:hypothetical protein
MEYNMDAKMSLVEVQTHVFAVRQETDPFYDSQTGRLSNKSNPNSRIVHTVEGYQMLQQTVISSHTQPSFVTYIILRRIWFNNISSEEILELYVSKEKKTTENYNHISR